MNGKYYLEIMNDAILEAAQLANWLIEEKGKKANVAYIIAQNKYKIHPTSRSLIIKARQEIKRKQLNLF